MPILFRTACKHHLMAVARLRKPCRCLKFEKAGIDAFDVDTGSYENIEYIFPPAYLGDACMQEICPEVRKVVKVPIMNWQPYAETAVKLIESGEADFVMFWRPLIADP